MFEVSLKTFFCSSDPTDELVLKTLPDLFDQTGSWFLVASAGLSFCLVKNDTYDSCIYVPLKPHLLVWEPVPQQMLVPNCPRLAGQEPGHSHGTENPSASTRQKMSSDCFNCAFTGSSSWTRVSHQEILRSSSHQAGFSPLHRSCTPKSGPDFNTGKSELGRDGGVK